MSEATTPSPSPVKLAPGISRAPAQSTTRLISGMVLRAQTAGAARMMPSGFGALHGAGPDRGVQHHSAAHAFTQQIDRLVGEALARQAQGRCQVAAHRLGTGPAAGIDVGAEAALVIGHGDDAVAGPDLGRHLEGFGIIVEAVHGDDDAFDRRGAVAEAARHPNPHRQLCAVIGDHEAIGQLGPGNILSDRRGPGRWGHWQNQAHTGDGEHEKERHYPHPMLNPL